MAGRWKTVGDSFGEGKIYDPQTTTQCMYDIYQGTDTWFNAVCFEDNCYDDCFKVGATPADCQACILSCGTPLCN